MTKNGQLKRNLNKKMYRHLNLQTKIAFDSHAAERILLCGIYK